MYKTSQFLSIGCIIINYNNCKANLPNILVESFVSFALFTQDDLTCYITVWVTLSQQVAPETAN